MGGKTFVVTKDSFIMHAVKYMIEQVTDGVELFLKMDNQLIKELDDFGLDMEEQT